MEKQFDTKIIDENIYEIFKQKKEQHKKIKKDLDRRQKAIEKLYNEHYGDRRS